MAFYCQRARVSVLWVKGRKKSQEDRQEEDEEVHGGGEEDVRRTGTKKESLTGTLRSRERRVRDSYTSPLLHLPFSETHQQPGLTSTLPSLFTSPPGQKTR